MGRGLGLLSYCLSAKEEQEWGLEQAWGLEWAWGLERAWGLEWPWGLEPVLGALSQEEEAFVLNPTPEILTNCSKFLSFPFFVYNMRGEVI